MPENPPHLTDPTGLPVRCYARHPTTGETVMLIRGQLGHWPDAGTATPEQLNARLPDPPTPDQVKAMLAGSMFGWVVVGPDPTRVPATRQVVTANPSTVIDWGGPDAPFHLAGASPIRPEAQHLASRLWAYADGHYGFWGWLIVASRQARKASHRALLDVLDLPPRRWRDEYDDRVPPEEAADVAVDEHASVHGATDAAVRGYTE